MKSYNADSEDWLGNDMIMLVLFMENTYVQVVTILYIHIICIVTFHT